MWVRNLVKFVLVLQFVVLSTEAVTEEVASEADVLPNIWEDEVVTRMIREVLAQDLVKEQQQQHLRRQYKRDVTASPAVAVSTKKSQTTRKASTVTTQKAKKPVKVTQSGNKPKRVATSTTSVTTRATVKPNTKPIVTNSNFDVVNNVASKAKPSVQPTKYHYYPHNQQPYFLPECAIQQVCNAVYVRLNFTQPLCVCPPRYRDPCSLSLNEDDNHTITLVGNANKKAVTLAKTCEQVNELRDCRAPRDWSILALQNTRTGKSHYLVICKCPSNFRLEGPLPHDQPTYAGLPGINVYGMLCVPQNTSPNTISQWKISQRPAIHTSYRTKNTTIEASSDSPPVLATETSREHKAMYFN